MWKELKERAEFFGEIVGNLIIDALFLSVWVVISYIFEYIIAYIYTAGDLPLYIKFPKYALEYSPPVVIIYFVIGDVLRSLKKLNDFLIDSLKGKKTG